MGLSKPLVEGMEAGTMYIFSSIWGFFPYLYGKLLETDLGSSWDDCRCCLNFTLTMSLDMIGLWFAVRPAENLRHNLDLSVVRL